MPVLPAAPALAAGTTADSVYFLALAPASTAVSLAGSVPGVVHAHARVGWTGRFLWVEIEGWVDPGLPARDAGTIGKQVAVALAEQLPEEA